MHDKNMRSIPKIRENIPLPAIRKVPMGIFKERRTVAAPKRKMTIPAIASSLFNSSLPRISDCRFPLVPAQEHGNEMKIKEDCFTQFQMSDSEAIKQYPARK